MVTDSPTSPLFADDDVDEVRAALHALSGPTLGVIARQLSAAKQGSPEATRGYVQAYRQLTVDLLNEARSDDDARLDWDLEHETIVIHVAGGSVSVLFDALVSASAEAPFSAWAAVYESDGVALDLVNRIRPWLGAELLNLPCSPGTYGDLLVDEGSAERFLRRVRAYLNQPGDPLARLMEAWGLSVTELAGLFGVRRQAVSQWMDRGSVPAERQEKLATLLALTDLLERKLKAGRLPGVARRRAEAYGGETMLDLIRGDRHDELLSTVRASFDWATAA